MPKSKKILKKSQKTNQKKNEKTRRKISRKKNLKTKSKSNGTSKGKKRDSTKIQEILEYWFGNLDLTPEWFTERNGLWFGGTDEIDREINRRFGLDVFAAAKGDLQTWLNSPRGCLALIILLDQFSLNIYREKPESYQQSELALPIAEKLIREGWDLAFTPAERVFIYLPLEHSEKLEIQNRCVELFQKMAKDSPVPLRELMEYYFDFAVRHQRVVARFGRFPDRNEVFGRPSTSEELKFLASDEAPF